jgi:ribosomal protein L15
VVQITRARVQCRKNCTVLTVGKDRQLDRRRGRGHAGRARSHLDACWLQTEVDGFDSRPIRPRLVFWGG